MKIKKFSFIIVVLFLLSILGLDGLMPQQAAAQTEEITILLHKRLYQDAVDTDITYQNSGLMIDENNVPEEYQGLINDTVPLNGAYFTVYDASEYYHAGSQNAEELMNQVGGMNLQEAVVFAEENQLEKVMEVKTDYDALLDKEGIARITVPKYINEQYAAYLIVETGVDETANSLVDLNQYATPLLVVLPIMEPAEQTELEEIHLYPKNVEYGRSPHLYKYGKLLDGGERPLEDVVYAFYRKSTEGERQYLSIGSTANSILKWQPTSDPLADDQIIKFASNENGLVSLQDYPLPAGTYYFDELLTNEDFLIAESDHRIEVVIPDSWFNEKHEFQYITVNGKPIPELTTRLSRAGSPTEEDARVYNYEKNSPENPKNPGKLPSTNEQKAMISIIGLLLLTIAYSIWRRRQKCTQDEK